MFRYDPYKHIDNGLDAIFAPAPVDPALIPPLDTIPPVFRSYLRDPRDVLTATNLPITEDDLQLFPNLHINPPSSPPDIPLPHELPAGVFGNEYRDMAESGAVQGLVDNTLARALTREERMDCCHTLALYLGNQRLHLEYTVNPLLMCLVENRAIDSFLKDPLPNVTPQTPLAVLYLIAMAQKWFTAVPEDDNIRVWVVGTTLDNKVQIYWAEIQREGLQKMKVEVQRTGVIEDIPWNTKRKEWLEYYVAGICREVFERAKPEENEERWPGMVQLPMSLEEEEELYGEGYVIGVVEDRGRPLLGYCCGTLKEHSTDSEDDVLTEETSVDTNFTPPKLLEIGTAISPQLLGEEARASTPDAITETTRITPSKKEPQFDASKNKNVHEISDEEGPANKNSNGQSDVAEKGHQDQASNRNDQLAEPSAARTSKKARRYRRTAASTHRSAGVGHAKKEASVAPPKALEPQKKRWKKARASRKPTTMLSPHPDSESVTKGELEAVGATSEEHTSKLRSMGDETALPVAKTRNTATTAKKNPVSTQERMPKETSVVTEDMSPNATSSKNACESLPKLTQGAKPSDPGAAKENAGNRRMTRSKLNLMKTEKRTSESSDTADGGEHKPSS